MQWLTNINFMGKLDFVFGNILLAVGGLFICLFLAYAWGIKNALKEIAQGNTVFRLMPLWVFNVSVLAPVAVVMILIFIRTFTG